MKELIIVIIIAINLFSIIFNWKMLKGFDTPRKIKYIVIGEVLTLFVTFVIYQMGSIGMDKRVISASRGFIVSTFTGANSIMILSTYFKIINRYALNEIKENEYKSKIRVWLIIAIMLFIFECVYVKNIETGILRMEK